ncbi:MAG: hypothetical protein EOO93_02725 [Pedobacter sp.]|nr:MAG: hypothetical protein EOO93_02725 [Pedobacter sp.]
MVSDSELKGKSILYIGVKFYYYHQQLIDKLSGSYGAQVTYYPERDTSILFGVVNRLAPSYIEAYQELYYKKMLNRLISKRFDYFLVIRGFKMPLWFVKKIKELNPGIKAINYQWDSNYNSPFMNLDPYYNIISEFDVKLSFDYKDVQDYDQLQYSPTFYTDEIKELAKQNPADFKYDLFYFGSYLPERYQGLLKFIDFAKQNNYTIKTHFYMPFRYYLLERLKGVQIDWKLIKTFKMSRSSYISNLRKAKIIIDVSNTKQTGMAMRVLDGLGSGKKIITVNKWISSDKAYNANQIAIIDIDRIEISNEFIKGGENISPNEEFTLDKWIERIFIKSFKDDQLPANLNLIHDGC